MRAKSMVVIVLIVLSLGAAVYWLGRDEKLQGVADTAVSAEPY